MTRISKTLLASSLLAFTFSVQAAENPNDFVKKVAEDTIKVIQNDSAAKSGDTAAVQRIVNDKLIPVSNIQKTTRLATGQPWRKATDEQKQALTEAFKKTLIRTYSGAFAKVDDSTEIIMEPFRGDPNVNDAVVRTKIKNNSGIVDVDYRLEKSGDSWKFYDFNVENIWLIQNYRNQFAGEINKGGIDGLIQALEKNN